MDRTKNPPTRSKINITALISTLIGLAAATNLIPANVQQPLTEAALLIAGPLTITFRTWFN